jgi:hypothetical protein
LGGGSEQAYLSKNYDNADDGICIFAYSYIGGLASLLAAADAKYAVFATYIGPISLFAGLGALFLSLGLVGICEQVVPSRVLSGFSFFGGYAAGGIGGAVLGFRRALSIRRRIDAVAQKSIASCEMRNAAASCLRLPDRCGTG